MTSQEFKDAQAALGLTNAAMADLLCCSLRLVEKMRQGTRVISPRTVRMIERDWKPRRTK
jgi:DNA-binding transcriptional regulator YdaS (Cro superfamily)